jgi:hypothetical protein
MWKFFRQDDSGGDDRTSQCAAARFIHAGNSNDSGGAQFLFITKSASPIGHRRRKY